MNFSSETYITEALKVGLITNTESDVTGFHYGHFSGLEGIARYFHARGTQLIPIVSRNLKKLCSITIEKLKNSFYNGMAVDAVIKEATNILGERVVLQQYITESNSTKHFLSHDGLFAQPHHTPREVDISNPRFTVYEQLFDGLQTDEKPRSREAILEFLQQSNVPIHNLDEIISYLIKHGSI